jgi:hypothetical protein
MTKKDKDEIVKDFIEEEKKEVKNIKEEPKRKKTLSNEKIKQEIFKKIRKITWLDYTNIRRHVEYICGFRKKDDKTVNNKERKAIQELYKEIKGS